MHNKCCQNVNEYLKPVWIANIFTALQMLILCKQTMNYSYKIGIFNCSSNSYNLKL